jgi:glycosyltransferase involved in cell wall biosynthesis
VHLVIAGASELWGRSVDRHTAFASYENQVKHALQTAIDAGRVHLLGKVAYADMPAVYAAADVLVLPSIVQEGCPLVILEAMAAGRAVIATEVGGIPELVDARTGMLVPPGDDTQLAAAMRALLDDRGRLASLGATARQKVETFSWEAAARQIDSIYQDVDRQKSRPSTRGSSLGPQSARGSDARDHAPSASRACSSRLTSEQPDRFRVNDNA